MMAFYKMLYVLFWFSLCVSLAFPAKSPSADTLKRSAADYDDYNNISNDDGQYHPEGDDGQYHSDGTEEEYDPTEEDEPYVHDPSGDYDEWINGVYHPRDPTVLTIFNDSPEMRQRVKEKERLAASGKKDYTGSKTTSSGEINNTGLATPHISSYPENNRMGSFQSNSRNNFGKSAKNSTILPITNNLRSGFNVDAQSAEDNTSNNFLNNGNTTGASAVMPIAETSNSINVIDANSVPAKAQPGTSGTSGAQGTVPTHNNAVTTIPGYIGTPLDGITENANTSLPSRTTLDATDSSGYKTNRVDDGDQDPSKPHPKQKTATSSTVLPKDLYKPYNLNQLDGYPLMGGFIPVKVIVE